MEYLKISGKQPDIIHLHEWQTSAAAMLYWEIYNKEGFLHKPRIVLTIHNMDNTGECRAEEFGVTGMSGDAFNTVEKALDERTIGHNPERLSLLKGGVVYSNVSSRPSRPRCRPETIRTDSSRSRFLSTRRLSPRYLPHTRQRRSRVEAAGSAAPLQSTSPSTTASLTALTT